MKKPIPPDPEMYPPDTFDMPVWEPADRDQIKTLVVTAMVLIVLGLLSSWIEQANGDELVPKPDPMFQEVGRLSPEIRSVFGDRFPEATNLQVLVQKHLYLACIDIEAKQPAWVAFRVRKHGWDTDRQLARNFTTPRELRDICLELGDYKQSGYEMGHLHGLQFVQAEQYGNEVNQLCAIAAQRPGLNKGPWLDAENRIRKQSETSVVTVLSGQLWLREMPPLTRANEPHKVASHCWITWSVRDREEAFLFPQTATTKDELEQFRIDPRDLRDMVSSRWVGGK